MRRWRAALLCAAVVAGCGAAPDSEQPLPPLRLRAGVDRAAATIFDPITLIITVDYAAGVVPELPAALPPAEGLTITGAGERGPDLRDDRHVITRTYELHAEHAGSYIVPPFTVAYTLADGTQAAASTPRMFLDIRSALGEGESDLSALRPLKPPLPVPRDYTAYVLVALGLLLGLALAALAFRYWLSRRRVRAAAPRPPRPAHETALNALAALERSSLLAQGRVREYAYTLSEILTAYLEGRFAVPAVASTSEQLLRMVAEQPGLPADTRPFVQRFLADADPIKFAQAAAATDVVQTWTVRIREYVEATRPRPELERAA